MSVINEALKKLQEEREKKALLAAAESAAGSDTAEIKQPEPSSQPDRDRASSGIRIDPRMYYILGALAAILIAIMAITMIAKVTRIPEPLTYNQADMLPLQGLVMPQAEGAGQAAKRPAKTQKPPMLYLNGIVHDQDMPYAIINNRIMVVGEQIKGATLVEIKKDSVKFSFNEEEFEVELD
ncbi:MAG: hypothetical protein ABH825_00210 [Candidatus Omnitrophota bacterium]